MLNILEESLKTKIYPCGGTYMYIDVALEQALPPSPRYAHASLIMLTFALSIQLMLQLGPEKDSFMRPLFSRSKAPFPLHKLTRGEPGLV